MRPLLSSRETGKIGALRILIWIALAGTAFALWLSPPDHQTRLIKGQMAEALSDMRKLHLAIQSMTLDNKTTEGSPIRWTCSGTIPLSREQWTNALVQGGYLTEAELKNLLKYRLNGSTNTLSVFAVTESDPDDTLLVASENWRKFRDPTLAKEGYPKKGFVFFRKGGEGVLLPSSPPATTNLIGSGGMHNFLPLR
jgi:hypothetical protein